MSLGHGPRVLLAVGVAAACGTAALGGASGSSSAVARPSVEELVGQRLVVAVEGTTPSAGLLRRIRRGEVGGVILFGGNIAHPAQLRALTTQLRAAARAGGRPRLIVAVDQEGGAVRRLRWAPPGLSAAELGRRPLAVVRAAGRAAGKALRRVGVDVDLAPVADVPSPRSFLRVEERAFGTDAEQVAARVVAFAAGLSEAGVAATAKHFPGIGRAIATTDRRAVTIRVSRAALEARDLVPFRRAIAAGVPLVMLANAAYTVFGGVPAAWSPAVVDELRRGLGFSGLVVTDALEPAAATWGIPVGDAAVRAVRAGADLVLLTGDEAATARVFAGLVASANAGRPGVRALHESYDRILALKRGLE